jgi:hypothetical protein
MQGLEGKIPRAVQTGHARVRNGRFRLKLIIGLIHSLAPLAKPGTWENTETSGIATEESSMGLHLPLRGVQSKGKQTKAFPFHLSSLFCVSGLVVKLAPKLKTFNDASQEHIEDSRASPRVK